MNATPPIDAGRIRLLADLLNDALTEIKSLKAGYEANRQETERARVELFATRFRLRQAEEARDEAVAKWKVAAHMVRTQEMDDHVPPRGPVANSFRASILREVAELAEMDGGGFGMAAFAIHLRACAKTWAL